MARREELKTRALAVLEMLPEEALEEVVAFLELEHHKHDRRTPDRTPYEPVALGGLWEGIRISDEDIDAARRDMWGRFTESSRRPHTSSEWP